LRLCGIFAPLRETASRTRAADIVKVANVTDAQISPNGQWVVYAVSSVDEDKNVSTLWLACVDARTPPRPLLPSGWTATNARWSPDSSSIAFLSTHDDQDGLCVVKLDKPEPRFIAPITTTNFFITYAGESLSWSPDSRRIAYISAKPETTETTHPRVIDRIQYKSRTSLSDNRRTHVWVVEVERPNPQQLTSGLFYDHAVAFSPRGDEILFLSNHEPDPDANNNSDIFGTLFKTGSDGGRVSRFSLFVLDGQTAGAFDPPESASPLVQPFQITSFSFSNRTQTIGRGSASEVVHPFVLTMGNALRPSEVWSRQSRSDATFERAQRCVDEICQAVCAASACGSRSQLSLSIPMTNGSPKTQIMPDSSRAGTSHGSRVYFSPSTSRHTSEATGER